MISKYKYYILVLLIAIDQASKILALKYFSSYSVLNINGAFSFSSGPIRYSLISLVALILFVILIRGLDKKYLNHAGFILILAGGISNLLDRIVLGGVVDFFSSSFWPTFNLADSFITIGAILIIFDLVRRKS